MAAKKLSFENITRIFIDIIQERYPDKDKVLQAMNKLPYQFSLQGKITILSVLRDAVHQMSPTEVYRSFQHRDEIYAAINEAIEQLDDELDDMLEAKDDEDEEKL